MSGEKLQSETEYLFGYKAEDDFSEEKEEEYSDRAAHLIKIYGWPNVFEAWNNYLHEKCMTPEAVINFANLFWRYEGYEYPIPDPFKFIAYFYYKIDYQVDKYYNADVILDSLATEILKKAGYSEADLFLNPSYVPTQDPKIRAEVEAFRKAENKK